MKTRTKHRNKQKRSNPTRKTNNPTISLKKLVKTVNLYVNLLQMRRNSIIIQPKMEDKKTRKIIK